MGKRGGQKQGLLDRKASSRGACCCCCSARTAMMLSSGIVFPFALTFLVAGVYLNEEVHGWGLRSIDLLGNMCIGLGFLLLIVSLAGLASWKFGSRLFLFPYFILMLIIMSLMGLTAIYAYVENGRLHHFLRVHWSDIQVRLGVSLSYEGVNGTGNTELSYEDAVNMLHRSFEIVGGIGITIVLVLLLGFCGAVRELGVRNISIALMISMASSRGSSHGLPGAACRLPPPTSSPALPSPNSSLRALASWASAGSTVNSSFGRSWYFSSARLP